MTVKDLTKHNIQIVAGIFCTAHRFYLGDFSYSLIINEESQRKVYGIYGCRIRYNGKIILTKTHLENKL